jgi:hypothetical protein
LHKFIQDSGIPVKTEALLVGGARLNSDNSLLTVADTVGGPKRQAGQPLWTSENIANDPQYIKALGVVSTYVLERAAVSKNKPNSGGQGPSPDNSSLTTINDFHGAAEIIKQKSGVSSVLFLGILGKSRSTERAIAENILKYSVGMGVAVATYGLGRNFYLIFIPGSEFDGMIMEGALVDLESGQLTWSNAVRIPFDPIKPENMSNGDFLDLLFHDIMFDTKFVHPHP